MKEAKRYLNKDTITFSIVSNKSPGLPIYMKLSTSSLYFILFTLTAVCLFSAIVLRIAPRIEQKTQDYQLVKSLNTLQRLKLSMAEQKNDLLDNNIHMLKVQEEEIKDLLNINFDKDQSYSVNYYNYPMIYTQHVVSKKGEIGRVVIDDNSVVEYFDGDDVKNPTAYRRAQLTAERLKLFLTNKKSRRNFAIRQKGDKVFAYADKKVIFVVYPSDIKGLTKGESQKELAKLWVKNIKVALSQKEYNQSLTDKFPFLDRYYRKKSKLYKTLYTNINYPAHAAVLSDQNEEQDIKNINHMLKLSQQEISTYKRSFVDLKSIIESYKVRFDFTPSIAPLQGQLQVMTALSSFGWRIHPILGQIRFHTGIDVPTWAGAPVRSTAAGTVVQSGWLGGYGRRVMIDHGYGFSTVYAHNSQLLVTVGQTIRKGQIVALAGMSGLAQGVHCHYEVRYFGRPINPENFLNLNIFTASKNW